MVNSGWTLLGLVSGQVQRMPNINYAARGYNLFYGNPMPSQVGVDPGFDRYAGTVFEMSYSGGREPVTTGTVSYEQPDGMDVFKNEGCYLAFKSESMSRTSEYKNNLRESVGGDVNDIEASFEASVDFHEFQTKTQNKSKRVMWSQAECSSFQVTMSGLVMPNYTADFRTALEQLPDAYGDGEAYFDFLDNYGTHVLSHVTLGARYGFKWELEERQWSKMVDMGVDAKVGASAEAEVKVGGNVTSGWQKVAQEAFEENSVNFAMVSLGSKPTTCCDQSSVIDWSKQSISEPMPIKYQLKNICKVLYTSSWRIEHCQQAMKEYCSKRVLARGDVTSCAGTSDPECLWQSDCGPSRECRDHRCQVPAGGAGIVAINRYWYSDAWSQWNTFHPLPAWENEHLAGEGIFYAYSSKAPGAVAINRYCHDWPKKDNTFHASPPWDGEHNCGSSVFYAYQEHRAGTVAINRYWGDGGSTFHPAPEWPNEELAGEAVFYAYLKEAKCTAHSQCSGDGDCCPTAAGLWMGCCDPVTLHSNESQPVLV